MRSRTSRVTPSSWRTRSLPWEANRRPSRARSPHADQPREMLEHALAAEKQAIADYDERLRQADAFGDVGLKVSLENQIADETRHKEDIERFCRLRPFADIETVGY